MEHLSHTFFSGAGGYSVLLDRILVSMNILGWTAINGNSMLFDHRPVAVEYKPVKRVVWRMNNNILKREGWVDGVKSIITNIWESQGMARQRWERVKSAIVFLVQNEEKRLNMIFKADKVELERKINRFVSKDNVAEAFEARKDLEELTKKCLCSQKHKLQHIQIHTQNHTHIQHTTQQHTQQQVPLHTQLHMYKHAHKQHTKQQHKPQHMHN